MLLAFSSVAGGQSNGPTGIDGPGFRLLLATPAAIAAIDPPRAARTLFARCAVELRLFPGDTTAAVATRDWDQPSMLDPELLSVFVVPRAVNRAQCGGDELRDQVTITQGLQFLEPLPFSPSDDVVRIELRVGDAVITPRSTVRAPLTVLGNRGARVSAANAVRVRIPIADLAPDATGRRDGISLRVWMAGAAVPAVVSIPWSAVEPLWYAFLAERSDRAAAAITTDRLTVTALMPSRDAELDAAQRAYLARDPAGANRRILTRLSDPKLPWREARNARVQLAVTMASLGDTAATRIVLAGLLQREPCLSLSATAPALARAVIVPLPRPAARCTEVSLASVALRSAVFPGFGRPPSGTRSIVKRVLVTGFIGGALAVAVTQNNTSRSSYADYQAARSSADAERLFSQAESARTTARAGFAIAAFTWGASITDALVREWRFANRLGKVRDLAPALGATR